MVKELVVKVDTIWISKGCAVIRSFTYPLDDEGNVVGKRRVYYDVVAEEGNGDILDSFKTGNEAREYVRGM